MKIGILTFHDGINHGGFLQAYSLCKWLVTEGFDAHIIHYRNRTHLWREYRGLLLRYNALNSLKNLVRILVFKRTQRCLRLTPFTMSSDSVANMGFDVVVIGSDIVWNYEWTALGCDRIYFGRGLEGTKVVSYGASFGSAAANCKLPPDIVEALRMFRAISVRDVASLDLLERSIPGVDATVVLDPTFLVKWTRERRVQVGGGKYLLVYAYDMDCQQIEATKAFAATRGLTTVALGYPQRWCDRQELFISPFQFVSWFQNAFAVVTSTFHGTLFAIHSRKSFYTCNNSSIQAKTRGFLDETGLQGRLRFGADGMAELLDAIPNYPLIESVIEKKRRQSIEFLRGAICA